ncbi:bifunctional diaminohydroxyphosphoribosylaminopyrimidine deaminase/5-amino-6-(5-phosphoribosylamino)uracil reductase RibD [Candidatus Poribacteria bacterium]|nr:bifunctional diaminohydroxyphosphoribosylaminopyrimidine deaminase/5-amino-6-(5-phosphoribosylamino)uracil reductase RibD [Candidatus Poribacteria bacterium]
MSKFKDKEYMQLALELAEKARGRTSPNPMVGAVIVRDDKIVGQGYHRKAGTPHAEIHAIDDAGELAKGSTMYVSLEPCSHQGRTGPCTEAIIKAGLSRVVMAMEDPNPRVSGRGRQILQEHGLLVKSGIMEKEAQRLNEVFIKHITTGRPFITIKTAMTLDGKIATCTGESRWISCEESRNIVHRIRDEVDAIMVGIGTVLKDDPSLTTRLPDGNGKDPIRIILDSKGHIPLESRVLHLDSNAKTIIAVTSQVSERKLDEIRKYAEVMILPSIDGRIDLNALMDKLGGMDITSLLVEGGARVNASIIKAELADRIMIFIAPKIVGGTTAPGPIGDTGIEKLSDAILIRDMVFESIGADIFITGYFRGKD